MTSCAGQLIGWKKEQTTTHQLLVRTTKTLQTENAWSCTTADAKHSVVKVTRSVPGAFKWNNIMRHIYPCDCNLMTFTLWIYSSHPWLWPTYVKSRFPFTWTVEIKGLCLQVKRSGTEYEAQKIKFLTSTVCKWSSTCALKGFTLFCWWVITYLFFHPINISSTWRHKFYWLWLILAAFHTLFDLILPIFKSL